MFKMFQKVRIVAAWSAFFGEIGEVVEIREQGSLQVVKVMLEGTPSSFVVSEVEAV